MATTHRPAQPSSLPPAQRVPAVARVRRAVARALDGEAVLAMGETVVVACSGGPDSTALVDALARLAPPRRLALLVAHVDHGLRAGSDAEAVAVAELAAGRGVAFRALRVSVGPGGSLQDRARVARHAALRQLAAEIGATAIAVGHTADDQAETVLMRALSGATPRALRAMGMRDGMLARPLLRVWRDQTLAYCAALSLPVVDDPSNADPRFLRSRVRHQLLPALEEVFPAARRRLVALAENQRQAAGAAVPAHAPVTGGGCEDPMLDCRA
ncbi:MAG TPA: tRNA lysidine(34) synthetase TilS [Candidatus Dormibacteraeota bacterium]|jgi:tRNA(Ile)-lysidine synthetase-like protein|nr:tRNA lysidine(34) synthetase TilS [Candidatus Dormibacteraeota bacterium]